jgi:hypothetical protein
MKVTDAMVERYKTAVRAMTEYSNGDDVIRVGIKAALNEPEPVIEPITDRCARFVAAALPGVMFVNQYGRRSKIIAKRPVVNDKDDPERGPWYDVLVYWVDADPSEDSMIWHTIGEPEAVTA